MNKHLEKVLNKFNYVEIDINSIELKEKELFLMETVESKKDNFEYIKNFLLKRKEHHGLYMVKSILFFPEINKWFINNKELKRSQAYLLRGGYIHASRIYSKIKRGLI